MKKYATRLLMLLCLTPWGTDATPAEHSAMELDPVRVNFMAVNTLFAVMHEMGHAVIDEFELPILGSQEQAADTLASLVFIQAQKEHKGSEYPFYKNLAIAVVGQRLIWEMGIEAEQLETFFWFSHKLSIQRFHDSVCLLYGSAPVELWYLPELAGMPDFRGDYCDEEFELALRSSQQLMSLARQNHPERVAKDLKFPIKYADTKNPELVVLIEQIDREFLPLVLKALQSTVPLPISMTIEFRDCGYPNAFWDPDDNLMTICYELIEMFYTLSENLEIPDAIKEMEK